jgi:plasmid stabilization system protein ParE
VRLIVYWTRFAEEKLDNVFSYYAEKAGIRIAQRMINEIIDKSISLEVSPRIGQKESLLSKRKEQFRYLILKNYKLIYWINDQQGRIEIVNLFDCRQNPKELVNQMKS